MASGGSPQFAFRWISLAGNFAGFVVAFLYFRVIDSAATTLPPLTPIHVVHAVLIFAALIALGVVLSRPWTRPLDRVVDLPTLAPADAALVRRRALLLPYFLAGLNFSGWVLAGLVWGVLLPLMAGTFSLDVSLRQIFGTTVIAGGVTVALIFFASEHQWRRQLPRFFPAGDLSAVGGVPRLAVRVRLLAIFLLVGVVPLAVLGMLAYTRALSMLGADPTAAAEIVGGMRTTIVFILAVGVAAAIGLCSSRPTAWPPR
jgi:hypothetical protein